MSVSNVRIANFALSKIGSRSNIESFDEQSAEARQCKLWYDFAREQALSSFNWSFARKRASLALASEDPPLNWSFRYQYPADCIQARYIENPVGLDEFPVDFDIELDSGNFRTILTNIEQAKLVYTVDTSDPNLFSSYFIDYLASVLGRYIAFTLTGKTAIVEKVDRESTFLFNLASAMDANEKQEKPPLDAEWIRKR